MLCWGQLIQIRELEKRENALLGASAVLWGANSCPLSPSNLSQLAGRYEVAHCPEILVVSTRKSLNGVSAVLPRSVCLSRWWGLPLNSRQYSSWKFVVDRQYILGTLVLVPSLSLSLSLAFFFLKVEFPIILWRFVYPMIGVAGDETA